MSFKGLHDSMVTDLGYSAKWPSAPADHWGGKLRVYKHYGKTVHAVQRNREIG